MEIASKSKQLQIANLTLEVNTHSSDLIKVQKKFNQIDPKTGNIIEVFHSNREVIKKFQISSITLRKISDTDIIHNGYKWRVIENA